MLDKVQNAIAQKETFVIETTLATRIYFSIIKEAQLLGYEVILFFFYLPSTEMAKERVKLRVSKGGHFIQPDVIERRYHLGIKYFFEYLKLTDRWYIYNNSLTASTLIARGEMPNTVLIYNFELWEQLKKK